MLPGIGGSELVIIAIVALVVVGPKDLPKLLRQLGRFVGKMRGMADDFKASFDDMARQSELDELRREVEALRTNNPATSVLNDVKNEMRALDSDIKDSVNRLDVPVAPEPATQLDNPQLDGLPPRWDAGVTQPSDQPVIPQSEPVTVVKKARGPRPKIAELQRPPNLAPEIPTPEVPAPEASAAEPVATPAKRPRKKAAT